MARAPSLLAPLVYGMDGHYVGNIFHQTILQTGGSFYVSERQWRRANFKGADGARGLIPDACILLDEAGQRVAKVSFESDGPQAGKWRWVVLVSPQGAPLGETGLSLTQEEAKALCERRVPDWTRARLPMGRRRPLW